MKAGTVGYAAPATHAELAGVMHPLVREWFFSRFVDFSPAQLAGVMQIHGRKNILISAPTGGTKTLTAFLAILNYLVGLAVRKELEDKIYAVYISPLRALSNDIFVNLEQPLKEILGVAKKQGVEMQEIRVGLRTGDTTAAQRGKMARMAPHILVTTPESLAIIITTPKFVDCARAIEFVIVDEIHALANKRGVHLTLTLERLHELSIIEPVRVGLSATISPLEEVAGFLVGVGRDCVIAEVKLNKKLDIDLLASGDNLIGGDAPAQQRKMYDLLDELIQSHKTTLIFTNTRNATEKIVHYLDLHFPGKYAGLIGAHHSSMSRQKRFEIEDRLRRGELRVVVTSTSLELGIDIGSIDLVVLLRSPKGVARALQRIGRAGHQLHANPKGRFIVTDRDDLVECAVLMKLMVEGKIDSIRVPTNCLDVLSQHVFGMAIGRVWKADDMLALIRRSWAYRNIGGEEFYSVISYLTGDYALEHRNVYAKIWYDSKTKEIGKRGKLARVIYMTNIGTIPEEGFIEVIVNAPAARRGEGVGSVDEAFLERLKRGDVFVLGGTKYQFLFTRGMKAYVRADVSKQPTVPSWFSEMLPLSFEVAVEIARFRGLVGERIENKGECVEFIRGRIGLDAGLAEKIYEYIKEQSDFSVVPDDKTLVVEEFRAEKHYLFFHAMCGRRVNDALSRAYGYAAAALRYRDIEVGINDNGFFIAGDKLEVGRVLTYVTSKNFIEILREAIEKTDVLKRRFRHCASRSLMILRNYKGRHKSVGKQQVHSGFLLSEVKKLSGEFPILQEARREVFEDLMDVPRALEILKQIERGDIKIKRVGVPLVSPFGLNLLAQSHSDLISMEDRAHFLKRMHELQMGVIGGGA
ncbi:MAG: ATP-dependent helicase [Nanoarchaeota archaeon]